LNGAQTLINKSITATALTIPSGAAASKVLTSDASGNALWQDPAFGMGSLKPTEYWHPTSYNKGDVVTYKGDRMFNWSIVPRVAESRTVYTLGNMMKFTVNGYITSLSMWVAEASPVGGYQLRLWEANSSGGASALIASVVITKSTPGWARVRLTTGISVTASQNKQYIVSFSTGGKYFPAVTSGQTIFNQTTADYIIPIDVRFKTGAEQNLFVSPSFNNADNFYTDVVFEPIDIGVPVTMYQAPTASHHDTSAPENWDVIATSKSTPTTLALRDDNGDCKFNIVFANFITADNMRVRFANILAANNQVRNKCQTVNANGRDSIPKVSRCRVCRSSEAC